MRHTGQKKNNCMNVPHFIKNFKTIGMLSEQEGESKHASVNANSAHYQVFEVIPNGFV